MQHQAEIRCTEELRADYIWGIPAFKLSGILSPSSRPQGYNLFLYIPLKKFEQFLIMFSLCFEHA